MKFSLQFEKKEQEEVFSIEEYEDVTKLFLLLEEFSFSYEGSFFLDFEKNKTLTIDYEDEFIVRHNSFFKLFEFLDDDKINEFRIWIHEQGTDYYLTHKKEGDYLLIGLEKGEYSDLEMIDFTVFVPIDDYKNEWEKLFHELFSLIVRELPQYKNVDSIQKYLKLNNQ